MDNSTLENVAYETRVMMAAITDWRACLLSKVALLVGFGYLFIPLDLIPDRIPIWGHADELGFVLAGFAVARLMIPSAFLENIGEVTRQQVVFPTRPGLRRALWFMLRVLRADLGNFFLYQYRGVDGFLVTSKNSGTHWLKFMLSCEIAEQYGVPLPRRSSGAGADDIIGHPRRPGLHSHLPRFGSTHTIPSIAFRWTWLAWLLRHPPVVVLVRDIRAAMVSHFVKYEDQYKGFSRYVRGDPSGKRYVADLWWFMHFFNRWGDVALARPRDVLVVRYEELLADPAVCLRRVAVHLGIELGDHAIAAALRMGDRDTIRSLLDPNDHQLIAAA
jgi:uncharacterized membrane protein YkvA (DUF1232 family)